MTRLDRYVFRSAAFAFVGTLAVLTGMIWVTQALRQLDIMTTQGQTIVAFIVITSLALPALILGLAPAALFIAVSHTLFRMNSDSEIVVASAAGISTWRFLRPLIILALLVAAGCTALSMELVPAAMRQFRYEISRVRADVVAFIAQPGRFTTLADGIVFNVRERNSSGVLGGIFINDARNPNEVNTYLADRGQVVDTQEGTFLILEDGAIHRRTPGKSDSNVVEFQRYAFDLSPFTSAGDNAVYRAPERSFSELLHPDPNDPGYQQDPGRYTEEIHRRLSLPLYVLAFFGIAVAALAEPRTTREGRGLALAATAPYVIVLQVVSFGLINQVRHDPDLVPIVYVVPIVFLIGSALSLSGRFKPRMPEAMRRHIDQMAQRVVRATVD
ncbi:LPS export ABC transporter permease LptF [Ancylobacter mangrovi]|uniref:LPS export ABC transporter permease LptF n=1 Tax=Ancylobacter mangrovi TaxID=2972472 RepID=A0A9X2P7E5_9HYPH|nr:LPS export ABC transporter permease LptF [Ancylobacter mangrovi]MCS0493617.1 LPS export ABC transporter permease LptF [Ancylobacter mangrovi]MCS0501765.1 LPS export ABC transporter permease LptF [Ancylobacter mangrovi]